MLVRPISSWYKRERFGANPKSQRVKRTLSRKRRETRKQGVGQVDSENPVQEGEILSAACGVS